MIHLHKLNEQQVVVNAELLEAIEAYGKETVLLLTNGNRYVVRETVDEVVAKTVEYRRSVNVSAEARRNQTCHSPSLP